MKRLLLLAALLALPTEVFAQCNGTFPNNTVCGNITGSANLPRAMSPASFLGAAGGTNGQIQYNNSSALGGFGPITGDWTLTVPGGVATLATVNANVGSFGSASNCTTFTVNAKGLITAASQTACILAATSINYTAPWTNAAAYPQSTLNQNTIYMTDFMGATTCDGSTDQTTNLQRFLTAVSVAGATGGSNHVRGVFAAGNCLTNSTPVFTVNTNANLPVNYHLSGYGTTITPNPANVISGLQILRGTFVSRGDESRTTTIEGLTINVRNNANASWGILTDESRVTALLTNCYAGDDGVTHNQGNFACYYWYQTTTTDPNTGAFYGRLLYNTMKGTGIGVSRMPNGIRIDGSAGNAMIIQGNTIAQGNYGIRMLNPCATVNANCAYIGNGIVIQNNSIENMSGDCLNISTSVPTLSQITGINIVQNRMETCTNAGINIATIAQQSTIWPTAIITNVCIACGAYISNTNAIQVILSPAKQWP